MNNRRQKHIILVTGELIFFFCILLASYSCGDKSKKGLIPEKTFTAILSDSYLADGLLSMSAIKIGYAKKDTTGSYIDIIESYGYTYETMEKTLNYYFINDPKRLVSIYDKIDEKLSQIELKITAEQQRILRILQAKSNQTVHFLLPDPGLKDKPGFSYDIYAEGTFTLQFSVTVYPDDQSVHPFFTAWYSAADGPDAGKKTYLQEIKYIKDGWPHIYTVRGKVEGLQKAVLRGYYLDYENNPGFGMQHAEIINLSFSYVGMI
jgi:hypothetical protein